MTILFRSCRDTEQELQIAKQYCNVVEYRTEIKPNSFVVGRFSVLPYYQELEKELDLKDSWLINSYYQHCWIADVTEWAGDISTHKYPEGFEGITPRTWTTWNNLPDSSFVVKGKTNSRKFRWDTHMFAKTRDDVRTVASKLLDDAFISEQGLVIREYIPLRTFDVGINGIPITNEWRCFFWGEELLGKGYYWVTHPEIFHQIEWTKEAEDFARLVANRIGNKASFFVLDIAQTVEGHWILIEINDGQMSGTSGVDPHELYSNLTKRMT